MLRVGHDLRRVSTNDANDANDTNFSITTRVVMAGRPSDPGAPLNAPIVPASNFHAGGPVAYAREDAPTTHALEVAIGELEGGQARVFASGMAAANAVLDLVPVGGVVVAPEPCYLGVSARLDELHRLGRFQVRRINMPDTSAVIAACQGADLLWLESPSNPLMQVADLPTCLAAARTAGARSLVDNTFATPILQQPLTAGADFVMHSVTKALAGHSDLLLGAIVTRDPELTTQIQLRRVLLGAAPSAFDCYLALRGMRTLALRVERASASAAELAQRLANHPAVTRVRYPGFGTMLSIDVGSVARADALCAGTKVWVHATSLGGVESLLERRRAIPEESSTVPEDLVRLSVGIEDVEDLWTDLVRALPSGP